jgi:hypothetical protein
MVVKRENASLLPNEHLDDPLGLPSPIMAPSSPSSSSRPTLLSPASSFSTVQGLGLNVMLPPPASSERKVSRFGGGSFLIARTDSHASSSSGMRAMSTSQSGGLNTFVDSRPDPDELFKRMTVGEVKRVEAKLRSVYAASLPFPSLPQASNGC